MKKFIAEDPFWEIFPEAKIGIIVCRGINNICCDEKYYSGILAEAQESAKKYFTEEEFSSNPVIKVWREAFQQFKTKKGVRSSIESLLKRVQSGNTLRTINPLVDLYNSISLRYALPCGGEDLDTIRGDIRLTKALGNEPFITLGSEEDAPPYEGEIIYKDDDGAICRCLNWRESERTMLTESTQNAFMCMELVDGSRYETFKEALETLRLEIETRLGGCCEAKILNKADRQAEIQS